MLALAHFASAAAAAELRFQCPERYVSQPTELAEVPQGWLRSMAIVQPQLPVSGGGMVHGSPKQYPPAELRGSDDTSTRDGRRETRFPVEGESWVFCSYGHGGEIRLFRRVDGVHVRECVIRTRKTASAAAFAVEFICK